MDGFPPHFIDVFLQPVRDSPQAQVALMALVVLIVLDVALGIAAAAKDHDVQSAVMRQGAWHKIGELGVVAIADVVDGMIMGGLDIGYSAPICTGVIVYLCLNEMVSCLENALKLDPELKGSRALSLLKESQAAADGGDGGGADE